MNVPDELRYTEDHEWARTEGGRVRVGITDYAQDALGDVVVEDELGTRVGPSLDHEHADALAEVVEGDGELVLGLPRRLDGHERDRRVVARGGEGGAARRAEVRTRWIPVPALIAVHDGETLATPR